MTLYTNTVLVKLVITGAKLEPELEPVTCTASSSQIYAQVACNMVSII